MVYIKNAFFQKNFLIAIDLKSASGIKAIVAQGKGSVKRRKAKKTGMEIKNIKQFMQWCTEGSETYPKRLELIQRQKLECEKEIKRMEKALAMLKFKCWYYETALADGNEDRIHEMLPDRLPEGIQELYDAAHTD